MYTYIGVLFVCFGTYLFVRALLWKTLKLRRHRKAFRNLWSRFELDPSTVARVAGSQKFFPLAVRSPGFLCIRPILYVRTGKKCLFLLLTLTSAQTGHIPQVDNRTCREHDVTTLPPISISRQHRACVTSPSALYCCGYSRCVHRNMRSVIHHLDIRHAENTNNITTPASSTSSSGPHHERVADLYLVGILIKYMFTACVPRVAIYLSDMTAV